MRHDLGGMHCSTCEQTFVRTLSLGTEIVQNGHGSNLCFHPVGIGWKIRMLAFILEFRALR